MFAELARRPSAFSARSARKKNSKGDSSLRGIGLSAGLPSSESVRGDDSLADSVVFDLSIDESAPDSLKKLGSGRADGAGDAWNVEPAKI